MKKKICILLAVVLVLSLTLVGCEKKTDEVVVMKIGHAQSPESPRHKSLLKFEEVLEAKTNGAIDVQIFPSAQLGTEQEMIEAVKIGTLQGARAGMFDLVTSQLSIYMMPFLFEDVESFQQITRGPLGKEIAATANAVGIEIIATGDAGGFRQITNNIRPIKTPADMVGLKIRAPGVATILASMEAFGANAVSIPYTETYQALKTGVADGQENPFVNINDMKFYEVQKYLTVVDYQVHPDPFYINKEWIDGLDSKLAKAVREAADEMVIFSDQLMGEGNLNAFNTIKASGVEIYTPTAAERQEFIDAAQVVYDKFINDGIIDETLFNKVLKALGK